MSLRNLKTSKRFDLPDAFAPKRYVVSPNGMSASRKFRQFFNERLVTIIYRILSDIFEIATRPFDHFPRDFMSTNTLTTVHIIPTSPHPLNQRQRRLRISIDHPQQRPRRRIGRAAVLFPVLRYFDKLSTQDDRVARCRLARAGSRPLWSG